MNLPKIKFPTAKQRQYLYNLALALAPVLVGSGLASSGTVSIVLTVIGAVLGMTATGTASLALSRQRKASPRKAPTKAV
jgi:hypothetical protein